MEGSYSSGITRARFPSPATTSDDMLCQHLTIFGDLDVVWRLAVRRRLVVRGRFRSWWGFRNVVGPGGQARRLNDANDMCRCFVQKSQATRPRSYASNDSSTYHAEVNESSVYFVRFPQLATTLFPLRHLNRRRVRRTRRLSSPSFFDSTDNRGDCKLQADPYHAYLTPACAPPVKESLVVRSQHPCALLEGRTA
jgi:hypothetical protein